jgi:protein SCO1/2
MGFDGAVKRVKTPRVSWLLMALLAAGCGSSGSPASPASSTASRYAGGVVVAPRTAPPLALTNYDGVPVTLTQFRGKAVLVTFVYTHCPNVCSTIVANLGAAQRLLDTQASRLQIIAVTTDPAGDTPAAVQSFLAARGMNGRMMYLLGSRATVKIAWLAWQIAAAPDPQEAALIDHTAAVFGVSAGGKVVTIYPADVRPSDIVHDVPLLAGA